MLCSEDIKIALEAFEPCHQDLVGLDEKGLQQLGLHIFGVQALKRWLFKQEDIVIECKTVRKRKLSSMTVREAYAAFQQDASVSLDDWVGEHPEGKGRFGSSAFENYKKLFKLVTANDNEEHLQWLQDDERRCREFMDMPMHDSALSKFLKTSKKKFKKAQAAGDERGADDA